MPCRAASAVQVASCSVLCCAVACCKVVTAAMCTRQHVRWLLCCALSVPSCTKTPLSQQPRLCTTTDDCKAHHCKAGCPTHCKMLLAYVTLPRVMRKACATMLHTVLQVMQADM